MIQRRYRQDIKNLEERYGKLDSLQEITSSLQEFSKVVERDQIKIAAYQGLINYIEKIYNTKINLYSRKTKYDG